MTSVTHTPLHFTDFRCVHPFCCSEITYAIRDSPLISNTLPSLSDLDTNMHADFYSLTDPLYHPFKNKVAPYTYNYQ